MGGIAMIDDTFPKDKFLFRWNRLVGWNGARNK